MSIRCIMLIFLLFSAGGALPLHAEDIIDAEVDAILSGSAKKDDAQSEKTAGLLDRASMPNIFVAADMVGGKDLTAKRNSPEAVTPNGLTVRSAEVGLFGGIDHLALGTVNLAVHEEEGKYFVELHEAFFEFNRLPFNLFVKLGRFFPDVGRLNSIHQHDWHFTTTPLVHGMLFDEEGIFDQGCEVSLLLPWPFYQELKVGFFNGRTWGHTHGDGPVKPGPLFTSRLKHFFPIVGELGTQFGFTYIRYLVDEGGREIDHTAGVDATFKWQRGRFKSFIFSTEYWYRYEVRPDAEQHNKKHGLYSYLQYQFHQNWLVGSRFDYFAELDVPAATGEMLTRESFAESLWVTFRPSEFSYFRLTFERRDVFGTDENYAVYVQADFILGYHPAHRY